MCRTDTDILISALKILSDDIQSGDGVANAAIFEGAMRIEELRDDVEHWKYKSEESRKQLDRMLEVVSAYLDKQKEN